MKFAALIVAISVLSGCVSNPHTYGYKDYDPCVRCGEGWIFLPNTPSRD